MIVNAGLIVLPTKNYWTRISRKNTDKFCRYDLQALSADFHERYISEEP